VERKPGPRRAGETRPEAVEQRQPWRTQTGAIAAAKLDQSIRKIHPQTSIKNKLFKINRLNSEKLEKPSHL
jgi:hypothetical protein